MRDKEVARENFGVQAIPRKDIDKFGESEARAPIAPLNVVARCHNIVLPGSGGNSAIASIFVLVRPAPPTDNVRQAIAYVSYKANLQTVGRGTVTTRMGRERRDTEKCFHEFFKGVGKFSEMPSQLRHAVFCDVLVDREQLAGRCRRGGTDVGIWLVDGAFQVAPLLEETDKTNVPEMGEGGSTDRDDAIASFVLTSSGGFRGIEGVTNEY